MAIIQSQLKLNDGMTSVLRSVTSALTTCISSFEQMQGVSGQAIDVGSITAARMELMDVNAQIEQMTANARRVNEKQNEVNRSFQAGESAARGLLSKITQIAAAYMSVNAATGFVKESLDLANETRKAEMQLRVVGANIGMTEEAYQHLINTAASMQNSTMYSSSAMTGAAAELATYITDADALAISMQTVADYAAGMSGGAELSTQQMVDYATQLGKVYMGAYDGIKKKGFELSEQQKEVIENGTDMEKALVLQDIIGESWDGLAESMASMPVGQITQLKNEWDSFKGSLGDFMYPAVLDFFGTIEANMPQIQEMFYSFASIIAVIIGWLGGLLAVAMQIYGFFSDNWSLIGPILMGIAAAFVVLHGAQLAYNIVQGISNALHAISAAAAAMKAGATLGEAAATTTATGAQVGLNAALLACPLTWIIMLVIALIVVFVMFTEQITGAIFWLGALFKNIGLWIANVAIGVWNSIKNIGQWFANLGQSIWAGIQNVGAWFGNLGMGIWEVLKACASNVGTAFHNAWVYIQIGFWSMVDVIMQGLKSIAELANKVLGWMGVNIDTSGLDFAAKKIDELNSKKEEYTSIGDAWAEGFNTFGYKDTGAAWNDNPIDWAGGWNSGYNTFDVFQDGWGSEAYNAGAEAGKGIHDSIMGVFDIFNFDSGNPDDLYGNGPVLDGIGRTADDIESNTGSTASSLKNMSEDLAYMRDVAEREAINRFTTAEIKVDMSGMTNRLDSGMDVDGVISRFVDGITEALSVAAEGVHA